ncbi:hypothetical protein A2970_01435 [Candidatus Roizmanbacteria bacterium RIFCSPLOWO2_01_FULL_44_13]|uniref:Metallo-beta-lactamase domain-containing protein n=1 Tax=Candidatus Roizmanbacteria bacterium RIFCSPLOWO2_01_FULL_44_13 TaxID=1802069 RepID=A0A1F7JAQ6_9BACT|nr:MAG: hypothetical protein A2970_01435 [Candidatus Roizmanbacteria bacterium RIFCSPLOWO2_01_FULL_44_13]
MKVLKFSLGELQANCYFVIDGDNCLIIDPADEASFILEEIQRRKLKLTTLLTTHGHFDHIMAVGEIQLSFDAPFYIDKEDRFLVDRLGETAEYFLGYKPSTIKPKKIVYSTKGKFKIIKTPGHTPGSVCYYFKKEKVIFTGDTLFKGSIGRFDFSYSNKKDLANSLIALSKLPETTAVYPGHGEATTIGSEKNNLGEFLNFLK